MESEEESRTESIDQKRKTEIAHPTPPSAQPCLALRLAKASGLCRPFVQAMSMPRFMLSRLILRSVAKGSGDAAAGPLFMNGLLVPATGCDGLMGDCACVTAGCIGIGLSSGMVGGCACKLGSEAAGRAGCGWPYSARIDALS